MSPEADAAALPDRDLEVVRPLLPYVGRLVRSYFRAEVKGFEHVPEGPVLFVGNHSGGFGSPDSIVFILAFMDHFGVERPLYWLGHEFVLNLPGLGDLLRRFGVVTADPAIAGRILAANGSVMVYPGGEVELHRPWTERNQVKFLGRKGFLRLARQARVPIVPVVAHGGHNTYLNLTDGRDIARALRLDRLANIRTFPISIALPWGLNVGDFLGHVPLPARIQVKLLEPIDVEATFGADDDAAYDEVVGRMQLALAELAA